MFRSYIPQDEKLKESQLAKQLPTEGKEVFFYLYGNIKVITKLC